MSQTTSKYILKCNRCRSVMTTENLNCPQCEGYNPYYGMSDDEVASLKGNSKSDSSDDEFIALKDAAKDAKMHQGEHDYFAFF